MHNTQHIRYYMVQLDLNYVDAASKSHACTYFVTPIKYL